LITLTADVLYILTNQTYYLRHFWQNPFASRISSVILNLFFFASLDISSATFGEWNSMTCLQSMQIKN
jgi:hypothetical protein